MNNLGIYWSWLGQWGGRSLAGGTFLLTNASHRPRYFRGRGAGWVEEGYENIESYLLAQKLDHIKRDKTLTDHSENTLKDQMLRLVTFKTFDQSDKET